MKKVYAIIAIVTSLLIFVGCEKQFAGQNPDEAINITNSKVVNYEEKKVHERLSNVHGVIIDFDLTFPQLTGDYAGLPLINTYYAQKEKDLLAQKDAEYFNSDSIGSDEFHLNVYYNKEVILDDVISISGDEESFTGGATNAIVLYGDVFDLHTGRKLTLDDIFSVDESVYLNFIYDAVIQDIKKQLADENNNSGRYGFGEDEFSLGSIDSPKGREMIRSFDPKDFFLTEEALVVFYPKYSLGPGASGIFMYEIPFASMTDISEVQTSADKSTFN